MPKKHEQDGLFDLLPLEEEEKKEVAATPQPAPVSAPTPTPAPTPSGSLADKNVWVIDAHGLIYQVFHALPPLTAPDGSPVGAVLGFLKDVLLLLDNPEIDYLLCAFDLPGPTRRHESYPEYKANRDAMPDDLRPQIAKIRSLLELLGIPAVTSVGYEADDVLATLAAQLTEENANCVLVTSDKDCRQLLSERVSMYSLRKKAFYREPELLDDWGITPSQVVDFQALVGDASDNVPGVPLIGPKIARDLIEKFGDLDAVLAAPEAVSGKKRQENLRNHRDDALLSRDLVRLCDDVAFDEPLDWAAAKVEQFPESELRDFLETNGFNSLQQQVTRVAKRLGSGEVAPAAGPKSASEQDAVAWRLVSTSAELNDFCEKFAAALAKEPAFAFDTETTSQRPTEAELVGLSICCSNEEAYYFPVRGLPNESEKLLDKKLLLEKLRPFFENADTIKVGQNLKYDIMILNNCGVEVHGELFDTMLADYLLEAGRAGHAMDELARRYLDYTTIKYTDLVGKGKSQKKIDEVPLADVTDYAAEDAWVPWVLRPIMRERLEEDGEKILSLLRDLETPLLRVVAKMEQTGVRIAPEILADLSKRYTARMETLEDEVREMAGDPLLNLASTKQLRHILFEKLELPVLKKTPKKEPSTDAEVLEKLATQHPLPAKLLEHRKFAKLKGTYADALPELAREGRIHASFHQTGTATGRLSCSDPNLQNIPIRGEEGREIRSAFVASDGMLLLAADYSQVELRVLAHCSGDEGLITAFREDEDIHTQVAAQIYDVDADDVDAEMRRTAKSVNFGIVYGQSSFGLAKTLGISQEEAAEFIDNYFARFPRIEEFIDVTLDQCARTGYAETLLGRRRAIEGIRPPSKRGTGAKKQLVMPERTAVNAVIQGTAADLIKLAMLKVDQRITDELPQAKMLLQVHDELIFEVHREQQLALHQLVEEAMTQIWELEVPLVVDIGVGESWAEAK